MDALAQFAPIPPELAAAARCKGETKPVWSFPAFKWYVDVFKKLTEWSDPLFDGEADHSPIVSGAGGPEYTAVLVWENAPLRPSEHSFLDVFLQHAFGNAEPIRVIGNVAGVVFEGMTDADVMVSMDLLFTMHRDDIQKVEGCPLLRQRLRDMGIRYYEDAILQGKHYPEELMGKYPPLFMIPDMLGVEL